MRRRHRRFPILGKGRIDPPPVVHGRRLAPNLPRRQPRIPRRPEDLDEPGILDPLPQRKLPRHRDSPP
ncbi:MAG TPA: hypothetical protein VEZ20_02695, partial [Allosphingosinicella sp.]|nr:hypothetical protein [Allosphingosinicella sp.]